MTWDPSMAKSNVVLPNEMNRTITLNHRWRDEDDYRKLEYKNEHMRLAFELLHRNMGGNLYDNKVENVILCIKTLREQTGMGLLEAKCCIEFARDMMEHLKHTRLVALINPLTYGNT